MPASKVLTKADVRVVFIVLSAVWFRLIHLAWFARLLGRDGDQRQLLVAGGFPQREEKHDRREGALRLPVALVNPEPVVAVTHRGEGGGRLVLAAVNPHHVAPVLRGGVFKS